MSQARTSQAPVRQSHYILIVDDSARLRYALADLIVGACQTSGKPYRLFHYDKSGRFTQSHDTINAGLAPNAAIPPSDPNRLDEFAVYTAPSPKQALFVINSPLFTRLTIICDVMMPADTEVGLVGMLEALSRRNLPVNLVFASSDAQNRYVVAKLVEAGKAYFVVKAGGVWEELSKALVHRTESFQYKIISPSDYAGIGGATSYALGSQPDRTPPPTAAPMSPRIGTRSATITNPPAPVRAAPTPVEPAKPVRSGFRPFAALWRLLRGR